MSIKKKNMCILLLGLALLSLFFLLRRGGKDKPHEQIREINPGRGHMEIRISTTGEVEPQNRLEIKPPIEGRIEKILVKEGQKVKVGDILALMSSTKRATLLDAARLKDEKELEYWENVYKATPLIAPIEGDVIVRAVEPGQTVAASDAVIVLSDRLIVKANVDEVDIGQVKEGQKAVIGLDAYPEIKVAATVDHISYESTVVNNVTIYEADILPDNVPQVFRSGMSANVEIITERKEDVLLIPLNAVINEGGRDYVLLRQGNGKAVKKEIQLGLSDDQNAEVISGVSENDVVLVSSQEYILPDSKESGGSPFMPPRFRRKTDKK